MFKKGDVIYYGDKPMIVLLYRKEDEVLIAKNENGSICELDSSNASSRPEDIEHKISGLKAEIQKLYDEKDRIDSKAYNLKKEYEDDRVL